MGDNKAADTRQRKAQIFTYRVRIVSFNVNGLRSLARHIGATSFNDHVLNVLKADILCAQETKGSAGGLAAFHSLRDYQTFSSFHPKAGRHGVSTFVRKNLFCSRAVEVKKGWILKTFHGKFVLYNCYLPFLDPGMPTSADNSRVYAIYDALQADLPGDAVVFRGDLNACYSMLDHYQYAKEVTRLAQAKLFSIDSFSAWLPSEDSSSHRRASGDTDSLAGEDPPRSIPPRGAPCPGSTADHAGKPPGNITSETEEHTYIERPAPNPRELPYIFLSIPALQKYFFSIYQRAWLLRLAAQYLDTFRLFNAGLKEYTCWNTLLDNRPPNLGTRIDYIFCSEDLECTNAGIMQDVMGSDHCPVFADFSLTLEGRQSENLILKSNNLLGFLRRH